MLNFEEEMKAVKKGYVVLDIDEYNRLRDEIAAANMKAYEAEQLANRHIAELVSVKKNTYGDRDIVIEFNTRTIRQLAIDMLYKTFSEGDLDGYVIKSADDMLILDEVLAYHCSIVKSSDDE